MRDNNIFDNIISGNDDGGFLDNAMVRVFAVIIYIMSAITTWGFFSTYGEALGAWLADDPETARMLAGLQGLILLEVMIWGWSRLGRVSGVTGQQITTAKVIAFADLFCGVTVSGLFVLFGVSFQVGAYDAAGQITTLGVIMEWVAIIVMAFAYIGNFAAMFLYMLYSQEAQAAIARARMTAVALAGKQQVDYETMRATIVNTVENIREAIPERAEQAGKQKANSFIVSRFGPQSPAALPTYTGGGDPPGQTDPEAPLGWQRQQANRDRPQPPRS